MPCLLEMKDIVKDFGALRANDHVNLKVEEGDIHALLGENGAGKSTLMNILYGLYHPTSGTILFRGKPVRLNSPHDAINLGIGMVHQHFMLVPALTVVENIILGMPRRWGLVDLKTAAQEIQEVARSYGYDVDPFAKVWQLSVGEQQRVEIIKALYRGAKLLILDEPTAVLTPQEVRELFRVVRRLAEDKYTIIFISHKLNEVMELCNRVTVLRHGKVVGTVRTCDTTKEELARMMVGREVFFKLDKAPCRPGDVVLELDNVEALNEKGLKALKNLSLEVRKGEILGIAGVDGNGQSELAQVITGLRKPVAGRIRLKGRDVTGMGSRFIYEQKVAHIPEDRQAEGLVMDMTIKENLILRQYYQPPFAKGLFLKWPAIKENAVQLMKEYDVRAPHEDFLVKTLSGGNQQKVVLAREVSPQPDLIVAMHPTRGLDVGATEYVHRRLLAERDRGCAVLLISTELDEIMNLSDRIAVIYEGEIMGIVPAEKADREELGLMMAGSKRLKAS